MKLTIEITTKDEMFNYPSPTMNLLEKRDALRRGVLEVLNNWTQWQKDQIFEKLHNKISIMAVIEGPDTF